VVACNSSIQFIRLVIGFSDVATLARDIRRKILLRVSIMTTLLTCRLWWLNYVTTVFMTKQAI